MLKPFAVGRPPPVVVVLTFTIADADLVVSAALVATTVNVPVVAGAV